MKLKYTITLLSLATPLAAEADCLQDKNQSLYEVISCLNNEIGQLKSKLAKKEKTFPAKLFRDRLKNGDLGPEMVLIPAGSFRMGDIQGGGYSDEQPVHSVYVNKFAMGKFEVTFAEYDKFAEATGRSKPSDNGWGRGNRPVINVSWDDAIAYTEWLSNQTGKKYRLPTEAEWEYAARAGTDTKYWWGNDIDTSKANYDNKIFDKTVPVGDYKPNPFGLYNTSGNVWEWTCSEFTNKYNGMKNNALQMQTALFCVAARGAAVRGSCARLTASGTSRLTATGTTGSGWPGYNPLTFVLLPFTLLSIEPQILLYGVQDLSWKSIKRAYFQDKSWTPKYLKFFFKIPCIFYVNI